VESARPARRSRGRRSAALALAGLLAGMLPALSAADEARYIVQFRSGRARAGRAAVRAAGGRVVLRLGRHEAVAARLSRAALARLRRDGSVEHVERDPIRWPQALWSDVPLGGETLTYGVQMVQADLVTSLEAANRTVCIVDSGYSQQHEDLKDAATGEVAFDGDPGSGSWDNDSCGHGTHIAGTVAAVGGNGAGVVGANPGARLHIVKVYGDDELAAASCAWTYSSDLVAAVEKCVAAGAHVVNLSLGGPERSRTERRAFQRFHDAGVLLVAAAGNGGGTVRYYPAGYPAVVSVAAVDGDEVVRGFSQKNADVELAAPGYAVLSTVPRVARHSLTADGATWAGSPVDGAPATAGAGGPLVDGGGCAAPGAWTGSLVLCRRGSGAVKDQVAAVAAGGGAAAVVYNDAASDPECGAFRPALDGDLPTVPAIALDCAQGAEALAHAGAAGEVVSQVLLPGSGYEARSGTSMAAPHVAAVAALVWSCHPSLGSAAIRQALTATARDLGEPGRDPAYGFGLVQARTALLSLGPSPLCAVP
jgi:subtilisin family serine protease